MISSGYEHYKKNIYITEIHPAIFINTQRLQGFPYINDHPHLMEQNNRIRIKSNK